MSKEEPNDFLLFDDSDYGDPREDGTGGPAGAWDPPSWYNRADGTWWWRTGDTWRIDPCPVRPLGMGGGDFVFVTAFGEDRVFTAGSLHGRGGLADLFVGDFGWLLRHYRKFDFEKKTQVGAIQREKALHYLIRMCRKAGPFNSSAPIRKAGIWRGPDDRPIVHAGQSIFYNGKLFEPGEQIGPALFLVSSKSQAPSHVMIDREHYQWEPADPSVGRQVAEHLDQWYWDSEEARDLFLGGLHCDMLCAALSWLPHKFVLAPYGSGKSWLLRYARTLAGGSAHNVLQTYSKAYLEQNFAGNGLAFYLDETESDEEGDRIRRIFELVRLLSDDGAEGGRGSSGGRSRKLDVHGTVTMAATVTEEWAPQDRSRITLLELRPFIERVGRAPAPPEQLAAMLKLAASFSPGLRARAFETWDQFQVNLKIARAAILKMGGQPRDADQIGHLVAGWCTMTSDADLTADDVERFQPFIMSLAESEDGDDAPSDLLNVLFSTAPDMWRSGERLTIGQTIAKARSDMPEAEQWRRALLPNGMRLEKQAGESWSQAWLWVATKHVGLDRLFAQHQAGRGPKRTQILRQLRRTIDGVTHTVAKSQGTARFAGAQSRYVLIPPAFLPCEADG